MLRAVLILLFGFACGGSKAPPPDKPIAPVEKKVTRVPIETPEEEEKQEDGVTFVKSKGAMDKAAIEAGLAPHTEALSGCYTKKVGKRRWLGGHVVLHWDIKADGTVTSVKLTESNLGSWPVEQCLLDIAWQATFEKPSGGDADFTVPLDFSARGGTAIWDEDQALRAVGGQLASLDECDDFEPGPKIKPKKAALKKNPKPQPKPKPAEDEKPARPEKPPSNVTITLYVGPQGKAQSIGFSSATTEVGARWAACAEKTAFAWRLPDPRGQIAKLAVRYKAE
jgi:TonB family protein